MDAQSATTTHFCKQPGCTNEARSSVGRYSYCERHQGRAARGLPARANGNGNGNGAMDARKAASVAGSLAALTVDARQVDLARAKAAKLADKALAAKRHADELQARFEKRLRDAAGLNGSSG